MNEATLDISTVAKHGRRLEKIRLEIENEIDESYNRIQVFQMGYEAQLNKWNKWSENQQSVSVLMKQLKSIQSVWKLQLNINVDIKELSKQFGFGHIASRREEDQKENTAVSTPRVSLKMVKLCVKIMRDIHAMTEQTNHCLVEIQITHKHIAKSHEQSKSSLDDIAVQLKHEIKLYSNIIVEIVQFAFHLMVTMKEQSIEIRYLNYLKKILKCIDKTDMKPCISFIHSLLCQHIFELLFDPSASLFALQIQTKSQVLEISRKFIAKTDQNNNLLCANVKVLIQVIQWMERNVFTNNTVLCTYWKENYLFPLLDEWIILWINLNTPVLDYLTAIPEFTDDIIHADRMQQCAMTHIHSSISYQENIENALKSLQDMMEHTTSGSSAKYLKQSLELLVNDTDNEYGLSSKILSYILPCKIREYFYESIRNKIKNHDYESFDPRQLSRIQCKKNDKMMITYYDLVQNSETFFRNEPCKISKTMFEITVIVYNICIFVEQMYYIVDETQNDIICLSTMYVDLFMDICRDMIQLWMSLSVSYHKKHFSHVSFIGFQFYNDCAFLSFHLARLSIKTNHGNLLITDHMRQHIAPAKYLWFTDYLAPLKALGKQYFVHHLHNQRQTILKSLKIINKFEEVTPRYEDIKQSLDESLVSISQFLNGCRSIIPDSLLYQIGGKLLECMCTQIVNELMTRIAISDISIVAAHNISLLIKHIQTFEILSNDLEYMTRNMKIWNKFIKLADILDEEQSLSVLTEELNKGQLNMFDAETLSTLICALFQKSEKRNAFIQHIESTLT